jgi:hypothetical protein
MGKFESQINYWIKSEESDDFNVEVMSTDCTKVPKVGEIIYINNEFDTEWAERVFGDENWFSKYQNLGFKKAPYIPDPETCVRGNFRVVSVKRYITKRYYRGLLSDIFKEVNSKSSIPLSTTLEVFEVFIEPFIAEV